MPELPVVNSPANFEEFSLSYGTNATSRGTALTWFAVCIKISRVYISKAVKQQL